MVSNPNWSIGPASKRRITATRKSIALTFDDGPSAEITPLVLALLRKYGVRATFFVLGENARAHPTTIERILRDGHAIGIHGENHDALLTQGVVEICRRLEGVREAVLEAGGKNVRVEVFRPPYGFRNGSTHAAARMARLEMVLWSVDSRDWQHGEPADIARRVLDKVSAGDIVLMHDGFSNEPTVRALEILLPELKRLGYKFDRLSDPYGTE